MLIPTIIFHLGSQDYVSTCIKQAEYYDNKVILIGDNGNKELCKNHYDFNKLKNDYNDKFHSNYQHISPNNEAFEKICIERWISVYNLMKKEKILKAFVCDSDVLIYTNISDIVNKYYKNDIYISTTSSKIKVSAAMSIWTQDKLKEFIDFITHFYLNNDWDYIVNYWNEYPDKLSGGISDMYLLYCFLTKTNFNDNHFVLTKNNLSIEYDLSQVINNAFFDNSIDLDSDAFSLNKWEQENHDFNIDNIENKIKKVVWNEDKPLCFNINLLQNCNVNSLHFHGCKKLMDKYTSFNKPIPIIPNNTEYNNMNKIIKNTITQDGPIISNKEPKISAILFSLNDNYTTDNKERLIICLNMMIDTVDEIIYIDWGSPDGISLLELDFVKNNIAHIDKIKHIKVSREEINHIIPEGKHFIQQSIIRNIGIRQATGDYIISTNVDIIFPKKEDLLEIIATDDRKTFYALNRKNIDMCMATAVYNNSKDRFRDIFTQYVKFRGTPHDINPIETFKKESLSQLDINSDLYKYYKYYIRYAKIWNCGDFQMAHRDIWHHVKGFEENMTETGMGTDTNLQKKICNYGYNLSVLNNPNIFHLDHPPRSSQNGITNDLNRFLINFTETENDDNWGIITKNEIVANNEPIQYYENKEEIQKL